MSTDLRRRRRGRGRYQKNRRLPGLGLVQVWPALLVFPSPQSLFPTADIPVCYSAKSPSRPQTVSSRNEQEPAPDLQRQNQHQLPAPSEVSTPTTQAGFFCALLPSFAEPQIMPPSF